jgi:hypothetical protein
MQLVYFTLGYNNNLIYLDDWKFLMFSRFCLCWLLWNIKSQKVIQMHMLWSCVCVMMYFRILEGTLIQKVSVALLWTTVKGFTDSSSISWWSLSPPITNDQMALTAIRKELYCNLKISCATSGDKWSDGTAAPRQ